MATHADRKIVLVRRATRLDGLRQRYATVGQARFLMERSDDQEQLRRTGNVRARSGPSDAFADVEREDATYRAAVDRLEKELAELLPVQVLDRELLPTYLFGPADVVVTVGQDGLVANTAKYTVGLPLIAANPDPARFDGVLLPFRVPQVRAAVLLTLAGRANVRRVTLGEALLGDGQRLLAFNDFFVGSRTHVSARYRIEFAGRSEAHSSSGVLVSTGAGSTGWLSSVFNMAAGLGGLAATPAVPVAAPKLPWDDRRLAFVVREPFVSRTSAAGIVSGLIAAGHELVLRSDMATDGVLFSDGVEKDHLAFTSGTVARIRAAKDQATLVVPI